MNCTGLKQLGRQKLIPKLTRATDPKFAGHRLESSLIFCSLNVDTHKKMTTLFVPKVEVVVPKVEAGCLAPKPDVC